MIGRHFRAYVPETYSFVEVPRDDRGTRPVRCDEVVARRSCKLCFCAYERKYTVKVCELSVTAYYKLVMKRMVYKIAERNNVRKSRVGVSITILS